MPEDIPMLQSSGMGIVTTKAAPSVKLWADKVLPGDSLKPLLELTNGVDKNRSSKSNSIKYLAGIGLITASAAVAGYYLYLRSREKAKMAP